MPKPLTQTKRQAIVQDILIGTLGVREMARKHGVDVSVVSKMRNGLPTLANTVVSDGVKYRKGLSELAANTFNPANTPANTPVITTDMVAEAVFQRSEGLRFFESASVYTGKVVVKRLQSEEETMPITDIHTVQKILKDGRETAYPKDTAPVFNNTNTQSTAVGMALVKHLLSTEDG